MFVKTKKKEIKNVDVVNDFFTIFINERQLTKKISCLYTKRGGIENASH